MVDPQPSESRSKDESTISVPQNPDSQTPPPPGRLNPPSDWRRVDPPPAVASGIEVVRLNAGVVLAQRLLWIVTSSIAGLVLYLVILDVMNTQRLDAIVERAMSLASTRAKLENAKGLDTLMGWLNTARQGNVTPLGTEQPSGVKLVLDELSHNQIITLPQTRRITECIEQANTPSAVNTITATSSDKLDDCLLVLTAAKEIVSVRTLEVDKVRLMGEFVKDAQSSHQAFRSFWLQVSQLILINLLLPVLTALLGYIFGSQQASQSNSSTSS